MANYTIQWAGGVPYKSKLPSAKVEVIDVFLAKVPNFVDGSSHSAAAQVILGGAGMWITGAFQADDADVTITSGKRVRVLSGGQLTTASGSTATYGGTSTWNGVGTINSVFYVSSSGDVVVQSGGGIQWESGATGVVNSGGLVFVDGVIGTPGKIQIGEFGVLQVDNDGYLTANAGSVVTVNGEFTFSATSDVELSAGGVFDVYGSGFTFRPGATVNILGTGGSPSELAWGSDTTASFASGAALELNAGSTMFLSTTSTVTDGSYTARTGPTVHSLSTGYTGWRGGSAPTTTQTVNAHENDFWRFDNALAADITLTLAVPPSGRKCSVSYERTIGINAFGVSFNNHDGTLLGTLPANGGGTATGTITFQFDGTNWFKLHWSGSAT
jgi:hypothetical protein